MLPFLAEVCVESTLTLFLLRQWSHWAWTLLRGAEDPKLLMSLNPIGRRPSSQRDREFVKGSQFLRLLGILGLCVGQSKAQLLAH